MIIDSHSHFGKVLNFDLPKHTLLDSMKKYNIDFSIVSNIEAIEFDHHQKILSDEFQTPQLQIWEETIDFVKSSYKVYAALWVKIHEEPDGSKWENFIKQNIGRIVALKFHPFHSTVNFDSESVRSYVRIANTYHLPVIVHTAKDEYSSVLNVEKVAKEFPNVDFVMVHMGLGTNNLEAIEVIKNNQNIYGDSTWVKEPMILKAINECGSDKILFGTDNPIDGIDTYNSSIYQYCLNDLKNILSEEDYNNFIYKNAIKVFKLNTKE